MKLMQQLFPKVKTMHEEIIRGDSTIWAPDQCGDTMPNLTCQSTTDQWGEFTIDQHVLTMELLEELVICHCENNGENKEKHIKLYIFNRQQNFLFYNCNSKFLSNKFHWWLSIQISSWNHFLMNKLSLKSFLLETEDFLSSSCLYCGSVLQNVSGLESSSFKSNTHHVPSVTESLPSHNSLTRPAYFWRT